MMPPKYTLQDALLDGKVEAELNQLVKLLIATQGRVQAQERALSEILRRIDGKQQASALLFMLETQGGIEAIAAILRDAEASVAARRDAAGILGSIAPWAGVPKPCAALTSGTPSPLETLIAAGARDSPSEVRARVAKGLHDMAIPPEPCVVFRQHGGVPRLLDMLRNPDAGEAELQWACRAVAGLTVGEDAIYEEMMSLGGVEAMVAMQTSPIADCRAEATSCMCFMSEGPPHLQQHIVAHGCLPGLVTELSRPDCRPLSARHATGALYNLSITNRARVSELPGIVKVLVAAAKKYPSKAEEYALGALQSVLFGAMQDDIPADIVPVCVRVLKMGSAFAKEYAAIVLLNLGNDDPAYFKAAKKAGALKEVTKYSRTVTDSPPLQQITASLIEHLQ